MAERVEWEPCKLDLFPRLHGAASCSECGSLVADDQRERHERWHLFNRPIGPIAAASDLVPSDGSQ